jgi:hypothetical protein
MEVKGQMKKMGFVTLHYYTNNDVLTGINITHAILGQVLTKRKDIIHTIYKYFHNYPENIIQFMTGHHW